MTGTIDETNYSAVLTLTDGKLTITPEDGAQTQNVMFADNPLVAVSLLQQRGKVRMNVSDSVIKQIEDALAVLV